MKKRAALIAASIFTVLAVLAALIFRDPSDIKLVKGVKPYATAYFESTNRNTFVQSSYSLHMSYDTAVRQIDKELPSSWRRAKNYNNTIFQGPNSEIIFVHRARYVTNLTLGADWSALSEGGILTVPAATISNVPHAEGWITVDTERYLSSFETTTTKIKHALTNYHEPKAHAYQLVSQVAKGDSNVGKLPIDTDTTSLASKDQQVTFFP